MKRYLLFDDGCAVCSDVAVDVMSEVGDWLETRALSDPEMQEIIRRERPDLGWRPALVVVSDRGIRITTGPTMAFQLAVGIGPRRAARLARLVSQDAAPKVGHSRRSVLQGVGLGSAAALFGLAMPGAASAAGAATVKTGASIAKEVSAARAEKGVAQAESSLARQGFATSLAPESVFLAGPDGSSVLFLFYADAKGDPNRAGIVVRDTAADSTVTVSAETATADAERLIDSAGGVNTNAIAVSALARSKPGGSHDVVGVTQGVRSYVACMFSCMGMMCGIKAVSCGRMVVLNLILACIAATCGRALPPDLGHGV